MIVASDGSLRSSFALLGGAMLATKTSADLHVFHAAWSPESEAAVARQAADLVAEGAYKLVIRDLAADSVSQMIATYAAELGDAAIVAIGTHARSGIGTAILGSTAVELLANDRIPIVGYGPGAESPIDLSRVVVCVDGSDLSESTVAEGLRWAVALDLPLWLIQVVEPNLPASLAEFESTYVHNLARDLPGLKNRVEWDVLHSDRPAEAILESHGNDPAALLVMSTHGRRGLDRVLLGSASAQVVRDAWGPVVLICPLGDRETHVSSAARGATPLLT